MDPARRVVALALVLLASCDAGSPGANDRRSPREESIDTGNPRGEKVERPPACGRTNIASDEYGTEIHPASGPPGTRVTFSGTTLRGEDWRWAPSDRLEAWWDTEVPKHGIRLVRVENMERCRFETAFTIPEVAPGRYKISVFAWDADPAEGYGLFLPHHFTVTGG